MTDNSFQSRDAEIEHIAEVPIPAVNTYSRLWQLETWLRSMVYVELRALLGDEWAKGLNTNSASAGEAPGTQRLFAAALDARGFARGRTEHARLYRGLRLLAPDERGLTHDA